MTGNSAARPLKYGYSTGSCAAAAAQAALLHLLGGAECPAVDVQLPQGGSIVIPVERVWMSGSDSSPGSGTGPMAGAQVRKDAGDDPDVTHGAAIIAEVRMLDRPGISIEGGTGVGRATKAGLPVVPGEAAINPVPRQMIRQALEAYLPPEQGVEVVISVPEGELLARSTMNPRLGIEGGISILGTSGLVRPMSLEAWVESLLPQLDQARAYHHEAVVLTPGGSGEKAALRLGAPLEAIIQCSNFFAPMLEACTARGFKAAVLVGQMGKMSKLAGGIMDTHSRHFRDQVEILAGLALQAGFSPDEIAEFRQAATVAEATSAMTGEQVQKLAAAVAAAAARQCQAAVKGRLETGCIITDQQGRVLGINDQAPHLWRKLACKELLK